MSVAKPGKGKPQTEAQRIAVLDMERAVVRMHGIEGRTFYAIERELGITHADRIYKRAMAQRPLTERDEAAKTQALRLEALHEQAWRTLNTDGLDGLAEKIAAILCESDPESEGIPERVRNTIERAYGDTLRAIPVALQVSDRAVKLAGLDHAARVADAQLVIDQSKLALMGAALVQALAILTEVSNEDKARVVTAWGEIAEGLAEAEDETR